MITPLLLVNEPRRSTKTWVILKMLLTARRPASTSSDFTTSVSDLAQAFSGFNRQTYLRLRLALGLGLRRQVFLAVCDDLALRRQLSQWLVSDLARDPLPELQQVSGDRSNLATAPALRLVTLTLQPEQPDLHKLILDWLTHRRGRVQLSQIAFQIVGLESLTRQPGQVQRQFLQSLRSIARYQNQLDLNLVLWVNKPWFHSIRQGAPEFWRWQTGRFEFSGDPVIPPDWSRATAHATESAVASPLAQTVALTALLRTWSPNLNDPVLTEYLQTLATLEQDSATTPEMLAALYRQMGDWYRDIENPDLDRLTLGIQAYTKALTRFNPEYPENCENFCDVVNDAANLYWMRARFHETVEERVADLNQAVEYYQKALIYTDEFQEPQRFAMLQNNLGGTWSELSQQSDTLVCLREAIAAYEASLRHRPFEQFPQPHAATQNNLGTAYWSLAQYENPVTNLMQSLHCYDAALNYYTEAEQPMAHGMIQNNLGTTYWNLSQCENLDQVTSETPNDLLIRAIGAYQIALNYRTPETNPLGHCATQNNLGTAYWHLTQSPQTEASSIPGLLDLTIEAYQTCLLTVEDLLEQGLISFSFDPYATHHNLGAAYCRAVNCAHSPLSREQQTTYLNHAIIHHVVAWQGWETRSELAEAAIDGMVQGLRLAQERFGTPEQAKLLSQIPPKLLSQVMKLV